jgi:hypothetical protein
MPRKASAPAGRPAIGRRRTLPAPWQGIGAGRALGPRGRGGVPTALSDSLRGNGCDTRLIDENFNSYAYLYVLRRVY